MESIRNRIKSIGKITSFDELEKELNKEECLTICPPELFDFFDKKIPELAALKIPGDFVEAGVWKGGTAMYMKHLQKTNHLTGRLWLFDTFNGFQVPPSEKHAKDKKMFDFFSTFKITAPSVENVKDNFRALGLLDDAIQFIKGNILETLHTSEISAISLLHIDLDFADLTKTSLEFLYPKLSSGGIVVIDDYGVAEFNCKEAVDEFRAEHQITTEIIPINEHMIYWIKE
jgi:O-methyltransferase